MQTFIATHMTCHHICVYMIRYDQAALQKQCRSCNECKLGVPGGCLYRESFSCQRFMKDATWIP